MKKAWLEPYDWEFVTAANAALCRPRKALRRPASDGYSGARKLWEKRHKQQMSFYEAADLCRECHRLVPFCNFNGNTFAAIARSLVDTLRLKADEAHVIRGLLGDVVAGIATDAETKGLSEFSKNLTEEQLKKP